MTSVAAYAIGAPNAKTNAKEVIDDWRATCRRLASASALTNCIDQYSIGVVSGAIMNARKAVKPPPRAYSLTAQVQNASRVVEQAKVVEQTQDFVNLPPAPRAALVPQ